MHAQFAVRSLKQIPGVTLLHLDESARSLCREFDPLKICVGVKDPFISGHMLGRDLEQLYGVVCEMMTDKVFWAVN